MKRQNGCNITFSGYKRYNFNQSCSSQSCQYFTTARYFCKVRVTLQNPDVSTVTTTHISQLLANRIPVNKIFLKINLHGVTTIKNTINIKNSVLALGMGVCSYISVLCCTLISRHLEKDSPVQSQEFCKMFKNLYFQNYF